MNIKLYILVAWLSLFVFQRTADEFWRFIMIFSSVMATCVFFYRKENPTPSKKKK